MFGGQSIAAVPNLEARTCTSQTGNYICKMTPGPSTPSRFTDPVFLPPSFVTLTCSIAASPSALAAGQSIRAETTHHDRSSIVNTRIAHSILHKHSQSHRTVTPYHNQPHSTSNRAKHSVNRPSSLTPSSHAAPLQVLARVPKQRQILVQRPPVLARPRSHQREDAPHSARRRPPRETSLVSAAVQPQRP